jgi:signal transduction histidine kinase
LIFVSTVIISLITAFFIASLLYRSQANDLMTESLIANGKKIIQAYRSTPSAQLKPFMQSVSGISNVLIQIYDKNGRPILSEGDFSGKVDPNSVMQVVSGSVMRNVDNGKNHHSLIGLPFQDHGESYALFLVLDLNSFDRLFQNVLRTVLISILIIGSLLILVAARYLVKPLLRLTHATKRMAKGRFNVQLMTKRKDEIGQLTSSFNEMAIELAKLDRMRQEFVSNVSHEIQTPLTSISGFTKALKHKKMSEESRLHYLTIIEEESERLSRLSQNLLQLSHLQFEDHPLKLNTFRLDEQLRKVIIALEPQWIGKEIEFDLQLSEITVQADEDQLSQVWVNLLSNGIKFAPEKGKISVWTQITADHALVTISDNGLGIPEEERSDIFKPFHKVDKSRDSALKGNGLGLAIVKQIIDIHRGDIQVHGSLQEGTTFTVTIPLRYENN